MALFSKWDIDADLVAVGSGLGGLSAAIVAHDLGKKVVVLEKAPRLGGVCAYSGGEVFVCNNHLLAEAGLSDSRAEALDYLRFLAAGYEEPALLENLHDQGIVAAKYFADKAGVRWKIVKDFPDYYHPHAPGTKAAGRYLEVELFRGSELGDLRKKTYRSPHVPQGITHDELFAMGGTTQVMKWDFAKVGQRMSEDMRGFGPGMMAYFVKAAFIDRKIPVHLETCARELIVEDGVVTGLIALQGGMELRIRARRGVVLAAGGYDWHKELPKYYEQVPVWNSQVQPTVEGDAYIMATEHGAAIGAVPANNLGVLFGYQVPGEEHEGKPLWRGSWEGGYPHALWVNRAGVRFGDESFYRDYIPKARAWDGELQRQPNLPPFLIFDSNFREKYPLGTFLPVQPLPEALVQRDDTLRGLAAKLGVDGAALEATVARFNGYCEAGVDADFGRGRYPWAAMMTGDFTKGGNPNLAPLVKPPFYGLPLHIVSVGVNAAGLRINTNYQVLHVRGRAIPGLYAAGNAAAPLDIGAGYQSGMSNLRGMVGGFLAGRHAAQSGGKA